MNGFNRAALLAGVFALASPVAANAQLLDLDDIVEDVVDDVEDVVEDAGDVVEETVEEVGEVVEEVVEDVEDVVEDVGEVVESVAEDVGDAVEEVELPDVEVNVNPGIGVLGNGAGGGNTVNNPPGGPGGGSNIVVTVLRRTGGGGGGGGGGAGGAAGANLLQVWATLSPSERQMLIGQCLVILAAPQQYDREWVDLCRRVALLPAAAPFFAALR